MTMVNEMLMQMANVRLPLTEVLNLVSREKPPMHVLVSGFTRRACCWELDSKRKEMNEEEVKVLHYLEQRYFDALRYSI
jgi:hypothetical protein